MKKEKKPLPQREAEHLAAVLPEEGRRDIPSDVLGSYTGSPQDEGKPVQDADDL